MTTKMNDQHNAIVIHALASYEATIKRKINTEKNSDIRAIYEKQYTLLREIISNQQEIKA